MTVVESPSSILEEIAAFLASGPSREEILEFRPSEAVQQRARELLDKQQAHSLSWEEERELEQFQNAELLMRLTKAKLRAGDQR